MRRLIQMLLGILAALVIFLIAAVFFAWNDISNLRQAVRSGDGETLPAQVVAAIVHAEDPDFYGHPPLYSLRSSLGAGHASLTSQLARSEGHGRALSRSARQVIAATFVEATESRREIARAYAENVYLGQPLGTPVYGVTNAAKTYFRVPPARLTTAQTIALAAAIRQPSVYSPAVRSERATSRRLKLLEELRQSGAVSEQEFERAQTTLRRGAV